MGKKRKGNESKIRNEPSGVVLSACLMVKDEESMLPRCLASIKNHVDEIIVVDTGSTDATVEIAKSYGARIYHHPWENDFSKHRNQSISYARGLWIFIIDADEECIVSPQRTMKSEIALADERGMDSLVMRVKNAMSEGKETVCGDSLRLFRNNGMIRYEGIVHNNLSGFTNAGASLTHILHYGYDQGTESTRKKFERTATLLKKQIADNSSNAAAHMYLSSSYESLEMCEESLSEGTIAIDLVESQGLTNKIYVRAYYCAIRALIMSKRYDDAEMFCFRATSRFGHSIDILAALTMICFEKKEWDRVIEYGNQYLQKLDQYMNPEGISEIDHISTYGDAWKIYDWMGSAKLQKGQIDDAEVFYRRASDLSPDKESVFRHAGLALISAGEIDRSLPFLEGAYGLSGGRKDSRVVEALFKIGILKSDAALTRRSLVDALNMRDLSVQWVMELADFAKRYQDSESAMVLLTSVSEMDEHHVTARLNLALQFLDQGRIEEVVGLCDQILKILALPRNMTLNSINDLLELWAGIGRNLQKDSRFYDAALADTVSTRLSESCSKKVLS
jgi:tetratricopeptide (TPR) repeat protein